MQTYMVRAWGGGQEEFSKEYPPTKKHDGSLYYYFDTESEMKDLVQKARNWTKGTVVTDEGQGDIHNRTIACMDLVYEGKAYYHEQDFGYGHWEGGAEYMYEDGNYSCDCNKKLFLSREYPELAHLDNGDVQCGDEIVVENFRVEYRP